MLAEVYEKLNAVLKTRILEVLYIILLYNLEILSYISAYNILKFFLM